MPPLTRTAMRRPRSAAGTSAGASGLTAPPPGALQDLLDLGDRLVGVRVDDDVVVAVGKAHLDLGQPLPRLHLSLALHAAFDPAPMQLLHRGRRDEDVD